MTSPLPESPLEAQQFTPLWALTIRDGSNDFAAPVRPAPSGELEIPADVVYLLTGSRADAELLRHRV